MVIVEDEWKKLGKMASAHARRVGFSEWDAEDLSQAVLIDLFLAKGTIERPVGWVRQVTRRKAWRVWNRRHVENEIPVGSVESIAPGDEALRVELGRQFERLGDGDARLWLLRRMAECTIEELGQSEPESISTLKRRIARTTRRLQRALNG